MPTISQFNQDAYPATDETQCLTIYIPAGDEFKWLLAGLLRLPTMSTSYIEPESEQAQGLADIWRDAYDLTDWNECMNVDQTADNSLIIFGDTLVVNVGNAIQTVISTTQRHNFYVRQNPSILGGIVQAERFLTAGTWNYRLTTVKSTNSCIGIMQVIDPSGPSTTLFTQDFYQAGGLANFVMSGTFDIIESGRTKFSFGVNSKNASSTGYDYLITCLELWR